MIVAGGSGPGEGTQQALALCGVGHLLWAAWKGADPDTRIWWSTYGTSQNPGNFPAVPQGPIINVGTSAGPVLGVLELGDLYAAWKGQGNDETIWYTGSNGTKLGYISPEDPETVSVVHWHES